MLTFLALTSLSSGTNVSGTGKIEFNLYGCCAGKECTTCEDTYIILDNPVSYNNKTYLKLKIENNDLHDEIYHLYSEKIKIKGTVISPQDDILKINLTEISSL